MAKFSGCMSLFFIISVSALTGSASSKHDPGQCPIGMEGHYKITDTSDMNVYVQRNADKNLVIYFQIENGSASEPSVVDGKYTTVTYVGDDGKIFDAGKKISYCRKSAVYAIFESNGRSPIESNTSITTVVPGGLQVQQIEPVKSDSKVWPRVK
ncbi:MAG: hypothetical protein EOP06_21985 [Proteobacteria bacterium]|nr:MAG: hypothetical protein EOP06_21985 [Pseudomonadota bacterium]